MPSSINASTTAGLVNTADTSGVLQLQTAGTTAISIDASQAVSFTNAPTVTGGTANGVAYLNGSKVLTTGSALTFDASSLVGTGKFQSQVMRIKDAIYSELYFSTADAGGNGALSYEHSTNSLRTYVNGSIKTVIDSSGNLLVGTTSNPAKITTNGNMMINAGGYNSALGTGLTINAGGYNDTTSKARVVHIGGIGDNNNRCGWTAYSIKTNTTGNGAEYYIRPVIWNGTAFTEQGSAGVYLTDNATSWTSASDERLKENLEPIANAVEKVKTIRAVTGKYKTDTDGTSRAFLIAQDVQAVLPEAVTENSEGYLGLAYTETIPLLVAAIKEQSAIITQLQADVAALKGA